MRPESRSSWGGLVGNLGVGELPCGLQLRGHPLGDLPDLGALDLGQQASPSAAQAGQIRLLGSQVLGEDDLIPFALQEPRREGQPCLGGRVGPSLLQLSIIGHAQPATRLAEHPVGQLVDVDDFDLAPEYWFRD